MWQDFVPATSRGEHEQDEPGMAGKKRRRSESAGDGETVSSVYESIVGKTSSYGIGGSSITVSGSGRRSTNNRNGAKNDAGHRSRADASPFSSTPPSPPSPPIGAGRLFREGEGDGIPASASAVFGPALNPNVAHVSANGLEQEQDEEEGGFFCHVCGERVKSVSEKQHNTSTLHIFNQKHRPQERKVQIHESNKGFQLLAGMGWNLDEGLGARKQGRVNPLQTTFKRGTTGLGAGEKLRPRVTHFPSHVHSQALNAPDGKSDAVRAHESLDRRRRDRRNTERHKGGGGGSVGAVLGVAESSSSSSASSSAAAAVESSSSSWGGFWGQGTHAGGSSSAGNGGISSGVGRSRSSTKGRSGGGVSRGGASGGEGGREGEGSFMSRKEREAQIEREKRKERRTRFELLSDVPEEYAALFMN